VVKLPVDIKGENSIREAAITIFLANKIIKPSRFNSIITDTPLKEVFQQFQPLKGVNIQIKHSAADFTSQKDIDNDRGFQLLKFEKGERRYIVQGVNEPDRTFYSFHELSYTRWNNFIEIFKKTISEINNFQKGIFINGIGLQYIDEFFWNSEEDFDLSRIMIPANYLPQNFIKISGGHLSNMRELQTADGQKMYDRIEVLVSPDIQKTVTISHGQSILFEDILEYNDGIFESHIMKNLNKLHETNKEFLMTTLNQEIKDLIKLQ
jgi:uncharacterized protein (TIGR04255 family)